MNKDDDPYKILGLSPDASESEIKKAFHKAALKHHPDKQKTEEEKEKAHEIFAKYSAAYATLTDPVKRYDWRLRKEEMDKAKKTSYPPPQTRQSTPNPSSFTSAAKRQTVPNPQRTAPRSRTPPPQPTYKRQSMPAPRSKTPTPVSRQSGARRASRTSNSNPKTHPYSSNAKTENKTSGNVYSFTPNTKENPRAPNTSYSYTAPAKPATTSKPEPVDSSYSYTASPKREKAGRHSYSFTPGTKEDLRAVNTSYSMSGSKSKSKPNTSYSYTASPKKEKPARHSYHFATNTKEDPRALDTSYSMKGVNGCPVERTRNPKSSSSKPSDTCYSYSASPKRETPGRHSYNFAPGTKENPRAVDTSYSMKSVNYPVDRTYT